MDRVTPIRAGYEWSASCRTTDTVTGDPIPLSGGVLTMDGVHGHSGGPFTWAPDDRISFSMTYEAGS